MKLLWEVNGETSDTRVCVSFFHNNIFIVSRMSCDKKSRFISVSNYDFLNNY